MESPRRCRSSAQCRGHFINIASTAAHRVVPNMAVYCGTKFAVRAISEGLRQEAGDKLRVTIISPGFTKTNFAENVADEHIRRQLQASSEKMGMSPDAIAAAIAFAIEQPTMSMSMRLLLDRRRKVKGLSNASFNSRQRCVLL